jgi:uncharacterized protein YrrD
MQFKDNTEVFMSDDHSDDHKVGRVNRVVIDPRTKEATHIIIRTGLLFADDKVIPIDQIVEAREDRITLSQDLDFESLPDYEEKHFIPLEDDELPPTFGPGQAPPMYWYPFRSVHDSQDHILRPHIIETEHNIPDRTVALKEGAKVTSADGKHVGHIERVFVDPDTDRVMTLLVSKGLLLKERMFIPSAWISGFGEHEVKLAVGSKLLEKQSRLIETWHEVENLAEKLSQR